jgi:hypothetical protein
VNADARQQPIADEGSQNADDDVADEPEPGAPHKLTGQPAGHETHQQDNQQTFIGNVNDRLLSGAQGKYRPSRLVPSVIFLVLPSGNNWFLSDRGHRPEIVFGVLIIVLGFDGVTG